jgi:hypothetical protein
VSADVAVAGAGIVGLAIDLSSNAQLGAPGG